MAYRKDIDKWTLLWWVLTNIVTKLSYLNFYGKRKVVNQENIKPKKSVILAPNHQNALMDAMAFVQGIKYQTIFLTRADIFSSPFLIWLLNYMKMLPVFRMRDGVENLQKNEEIFDITVDILKNNRNPLLIFPEGNHGDRRRLRPLVKGIFRIAFKAQETFKDKPGVQIIPSGIDYGHYQKRGHSLFMNIGKPIEVSEYWKAYEENPALAINQLRKRLATDMSKLMIDIQTEDYYKLYMDLRNIYGPQMCAKLQLKPYDLEEKFKADKKMIASLDSCLEQSPKKIEELNNVYTEYSKLRDKLSLRDWVPQRKKYSIFFQSLLILISIIVAPLALLGVFNNWPHYFLAPRIKKGIKDTQFQSTAIWGATMVISIIYHIILTTLALIFLPGWLLKIAYIITLFASGTFALSYRNFLVKSWARIRYTWQKRKPDSSMSILKQKFDTIINQTDSILDEFKSV